MRLLNTIDASSLLSFPHSVCKTQRSCRRRAVQSISHSIELCLQPRRLRGLCSAPPLPDGRCARLAWPLPCLVSQDRRGARINSWLCSLQRARDCRPKGVLTRPQRGGVVCSLCASLCASRSCCDKYGFAPSPSDRRQLPPITGSERERERERERDLLGAARKRLNGID